MKETRTILYVVGIAFLVVDAVYFAWSLQADNFELVGLMTIGFSGVMSVMLAFYFGRENHAVGSEHLPEDRTDARVDDGDPETGFFSPWSWWPILLAAAITIAILGLAISPWIMMLALPPLAITVVGWQFEYYRGHFAR